jgi:hypothetical protein
LGNGGGGSSSDKPVIRRDHLNISAATMGIGGGYPLIAAEEDEEDQEDQEEEEEVDEEEDRDEYGDDLTQQEVQNQ